MEQTSEGSGSSENKNKSRMVEQVFCGCSRILDVGCGSNWLKSNAKRTVIGIDLRKKFADVAADCRELPFKSESFDGVFAHHVAEHIHNPEDCIKEMNRVLKHGGTVFIEVPSEWDTDTFYQYDHYYYFTKKTMKAMLEKNGFHVIKLYYGALEVGAIKNYFMYRMLSYAGYLLSLICKKRRKVLRAIAKKEYNT